MKPLIHHVRTRPRLFAAAAVGLGTGLALSGTASPVTRVLAGWNGFVWLYLALVAHQMVVADHGSLKRAARAQEEGAGTVLAIVVGAALASIAAIVLELATSKAAGGTRAALPHIAFTLCTVTGSWLVVATLFSLNYAGLYYRESAEGAGLMFPGAAPGYKANYADFVYFAFTIAVASQTADVAVSSPRMRRLVIVQSVLSFVFNTTILALTVNIAAGLV